MFKCDEGMCKWSRTNFRCPITGANKDNMEVHEHVNTNISHLKKKKLNISFSIKQYSINHYTNYKTKH